MKPGCTVCHSALVSGDPHGLGLHSTKIHFSISCNDSSITSCILFGWSSKVPSKVPACNGTWVSGVMYSPMLLHMEKIRIIH